MNGLPTHSAAFHNGLLTCVNKMRQVYNTLETIQDVFTNEIGSSSKDLRQLLVYKHVDQFHYVVCDFWHVAENRISLTQIFSSHAGADAFHT